MSEQHICSQPARWQLCWPGRDPWPICVRHRTEAERIAYTMDWDLHFFPAEPQAVCAPKVSKTP